MKKVIKSVATLFFLASVGYQTQSIASTLAEEYIHEADECKVAGLGGAYLTFADKFGGEINKEELSSTKELGVAGCAAGSKIYAFSLVIKTNGVIKRFTGESYILTGEILKILHSLKPGDTFEFSKIKAHLPTGAKIDALGRLYTVV